MRRVSRRKFLEKTSQAGIAMGANLAFGSGVLGQTPAANAEQPIRVYADARRTIAPVQREVFGSFLEHLGRASNVPVRLLHCLND